MCKFRLSCAVCLKYDCKLVKIGKTDNENIKYSCKLTFCIPEIEWNEDRAICFSCLDQLNSACTFRNLCMQSNVTTIRKPRARCECVLCTFKQEPVYTCHDCSKVFFTKLSLIKHIQSEHAVMKFDELKTESFDDSIGFNEAVDSCKKPTKKKTFSCDECQTSFITNRKLIDHCLSTHGFSARLVKPFECDKCESKFSSSSNLLQHKQYHLGERIHICTFCGKGYITKSDLNTHEKQHLNKREYRCVDCPKTFNTNKNLRSHRIVVHTDSSLWNYVCAFCQKRFPIKSNLDQHTRRHTGEKRFACHICEKRFVDKVVMQKHVGSHSNFRAFKCERCNKEYKDDKVLEVHLTKVHGVGNAKIPVREKKYFCDVCPKAYFAKNKLTRHMLAHTGEKPYVCYVCGKQFRDNAYVKHHLRNTHGVTFSTEH